MDNNFEPKKVVKKAGSLLIAGALSMGLAVSEIAIVYDRNTDHTKELCPLTRVLGGTHQYHAMESDYKENGIDAAVTFYYVLKEQGIDEFIYDAYVTGWQDKQVIDSIYLGTHSNQKVRNF